MITGFGNGFGLELAKSLHGMGLTVFAGAERGRPKGKDSRSLQK